MLKVEYLSMSFQIIGDLKAHFFFYKILKGDLQAFNIACFSCFNSFIKFLNFVLQTIFQSC